MKHFAQIDAGIVTGLLQSDTMPSVLPPGRSFVEIRPDHGAVDCFATYDAQHDTFAPPAPDLRRWADTKTVLREFTPTEYVALKQLALSLTTPAVTYALAVFDASTVVDTDDPVIEPLFSLLSTARKNEIKDKAKSKQ